MTKTNYQPIFRCYNNSLKSSAFSAIVGNSLFDLIGKKEPHQTKCLGYVLARSTVAMKHFLDLLNNKYIGSFPVKSLMKDEYFIDCEFELPKAMGSPARADIVIQFPKSNVVVVVEAKSLKAKTSVSDAINQGISYVTLMQSHGLITSSYKTIVIGLTNHHEYSPLGIALKWSDIIDMFATIVKKYRDNAQLEKDLLNYLLKIKSFMNYYDVEVLSIPAGKTLPAVKKTGIYECPTVGRNYASRGEHRPLYIAFRGKKGYVDTLYRVSDLMKIPIHGIDYDSKIAPNLPTNIANKINDYKNCINYNPSDIREKWVFILDSKKIDLPNPVIYSKPNTYIDTRHSLADYFAKPLKGSKYIIF